MTSNDRIAVDVLISESCEEHNRLADAEAVCRAYGRLIDARRRGVHGNEQAALASLVTIAWERWERRWGES